jgi:hypothetical protein
MSIEDYFIKCPDGNPHEWENDHTTGRFACGYSLYGMSYVIKCKKCGRIQAIDTSD